MKIPEIEIVIGKYIKNEVLPNIPNQLERFIVGAGSTLLVGKSEMLINKHLDMLQKMDIINEEGNVDIDKLYTAAKDGMAAAGGNVKYKSLIFNQNDIDKLYSMLKG